MKRLFDDKDYYTDKARELHNDVTIFLRELAKSYSQQEYSLREVGEIFSEAASSIINELILERMIKK